MDLHLKNKAMLIAGASSGLGYSVAEQLCAEGARVLLLSRDEDRVGAAAERIRRDTGGECLPFAGDVRDPDHLRVWVEEAAERWGGVDGLLVNAGGPPKGRFPELDDDAWRQGFELTLLSAVRMIRLALPWLKRSSTGSILTVTSTSVREPIDFLLLSNVMRSGVLSLVKSLSRELADDGIRVNNLIPGFIATERLSVLEEAVAGEQGVSLDDQRTEFQADIPLGRYGSPGEFAQAACFLLSPAASYVTGASLVVDGGRLRGAW